MEDKAAWARESWFFVCDKTGHRDGRGHKIQSFKVPWGKVKTVCGLDVAASFVVQNPHRRSDVLCCPECSDKIRSGEWVYQSEDKAT
jgi:hypothetical protein